jgi:hypothetical protein
MKLRVGFSRRVAWDLGGGLGRRAVLSGGLGPANDSSSEHYLDLFFWRAARHRFEPGLFRRARVQACNVGLQPTHEKQQAHDGKRPRHEDDQKKDLIRSHTQKCLRR